MISTILFITSDSQYYAGRDFPATRSVTVHGTIVDRGYDRYYHRGHISKKYFYGVVYYYDKQGNKYPIELPASSAGSYRFSSDAIVMYDVDHPQKARLISLNGKPQYIYTQTGEGIGSWAKLCLALGLVTLFSIAQKLDKKSSEPLMKEYDQYGYRRKYSRRKRHAKR